EFKLCRSSAETARNINEVWGKSIVVDSTVRIWFRKFRFGDLDFEDKEDRRRPKELDGDKLKALVEALHTSNC
ncbi:hypothetical protein Angca_009917, partial [Angiostrongylus cantonensis]